MNMLLPSFAFLVYCFPCTSTSICGTKLHLVDIYKAFEDDEIFTVAWLILTRKLIYHELE
jgi:hypothetical protein